MAHLQPRFIRLRDAPAYLGMDRNRFAREVRPVITEIPMGAQGIAFSDRNGANSIGGFLDVITLS